MKKIFKQQAKPHKEYSQQALLFSDLPLFILRCYFIRVCLPKAQIANTVDLPAINLILPLLFPLTVKLTIWVI